MINNNFQDLYNKTLIDPDVYSGALIKGKVIEINNNFVTINTFLKADGYVPTSQFRSDNGELEIKIGSDIELVIENIEDFNGDIKLSREKAKRIRTWENLENVYNNNETISGHITAKVKGGFTVKLDAVKAFLPGSLISFKLNADSDDIKGKKLKFKIIKLEKKKNNVVVSQKFILEEKNNKNPQFISEKINEGEIVSGIVKNITDYGVFIDLGGLDGLLHITDMSWKRVKHPSNIVKIGEEIKVKILKFDRNANRVSLGLKQLTIDPWVNVKKKYKEGQKVNGKVTNITDYGCFVEIEPGIEGLVHLSEMDWSNKNINPNKVVKHGIEIKVSILDINSKKRRISLGLKQCMNNPWLSFVKKYKTGDRVFGKIKSITDFGLFLELAGGIDGLVHLSDISWDNQNNDLILRNFKRGDEIQIAVLGTNHERERISLGIKQLNSNNFFDYINKIKRRSKVDCKIIKKLDKGCIVNLADKVDGFLRLNDDQMKGINLNSFIKSRIINIDKKNRNITLVTESEYETKYQK